MLDDFFTRALLAAIMTSIITGPLGCFVVWRRMSYFGDTIAHAALLGVALSFALEMNLVLSVLMITILGALFLLYMQSRVYLSIDALLGILSHATLAIGLVLISFLSWMRVDLTSFLFGDILAVDVTDLLIIAIVGTLILIMIYFIWQPLLIATVNQELAAVEGYHPKLYHGFYTILLGAVIAVSIKVIGVLLITALLIIPAATARLMSKTPEKMAFLAILFGVSSSISGLYGSLYLDTPSGPSIVVIAFILFCFSLLGGKLISLFRASGSQTE